MRNNMNLVENLTKLNLTICTAESITGGMIASNICNIEGASQIFNGGIVAYTKKMKQKLLGLNIDDINKYGVYSEKTVFSMAKAVKEKTESDIAIATSGVAGPYSDENVAPGTVYFCFYIKDKYFLEKKVFNGSRNEVRSKASMYACERLIDLL